MKTAEIEDLEIREKIRKEIWIKEKAKGTSVKAIEMGMNNDVIISLIGLSDKEISIIRLEMSK